MTTRLDLTNMYINKYLKIYSYFILVNDKDKENSYMVEAITKGIEGENRYEILFKTKEDANIFIDRLLKEYGIKKKESPIDADVVKSSFMEMWRTAFKYEGDWIKREALLVPEVGD